VALYRPGPMAANMHRDYPDRKNGRKPHLPAPRSRAHSEGHLRADALPGVGDAGGPEVRRLLARGSGQPAQGLRQEDPPSLAAEREKFVAGCVTQGYGEKLGTSCSTSSSRSPTTPSTSPTPTATAWWPTRRRGSRPTTRSEYMAALLTSVKDNKDKTAVYLAECRNRASPSCRPTSTARWPSSLPITVGRPGPGQAILFGWRRCATWARAWWSASWPSATPTAPSRTSSTSASGSTRWSSTSAPWSHWSRGRLRRLGPPRQGLCLVMEGIVDRTLERGGSTTSASPPCSPRSRTEQESDPGWGDGQDRHPRHRVRQGAATGLREGDARALRERPSPDGLRAGAGPPHRLQPLGHAGGETYRGTVPPCGPSAAW
jgi:hypothetical protein